MTFLKVQAVVKKYDILFIADEVTSKVIEKFMKLKLLNFGSKISSRSFVPLEGWGQCLGATSTELNPTLFPWPRSVNHLS